MRGGRGATTCSALGYMATLKELSVMWRDYGVLVSFGLVGRVEGKFMLQQANMGL